MPRNGHGEPSNVYVLARSLCLKGSLNVSSKQRLTLALVELCDRIKDEFLRVSKDWQVSAQDLRRCYSYAYPASVPGTADPLCLEQACEGLMTSLRNEIAAYSTQFGVPDDMLQRLLTDWLVSEAMCKDRTPTAFFIPEDQQAEDGPAEVLPRVFDVIRAITGRGPESKLGDRHEAGKRGPGDVVKERPTVELRTGLEPGS